MDVCSPLPEERKEKLTGNKEIEQINETSPEGDVVNLHYRFWR